MTSFKHTKSLHHSLKLRILRALQRSWLYPTMSWFWHNLLNWFLINCSNKTTILTTTQCLKIPYFVHNLMIFSWLQKNKHFKLWHPRRSIIWTISTLWWVDKYTIHLHLLYFYKYSVMTAFLNLKRSIRYCKKSKKKKEKKSILYPICGKWHFITQCGLCGAFVYLSLNV